MIHRSLLAHSGPTQGFGFEPADTTWLDGSDEIPRAAKAIEVCSAGGGRRLALINQKASEKFFTIVTTSSPICANTGGWRHPTDVFDQFGFETVSLQLISSGKQLGFVQQSAFLRKGEGVISQWRLCFECEELAPPIKYNPPPSNSHPLRGWVGVKRIQHQV